MSLEILAQPCLPICFDQLSGCIRPHWELGTEAAKRSDSTQREIHIREAPLAQSRKSKIAIHCHAYYLDVFCELADAWQSIHNRCLLINTDSRSKARLIEAMLKARGEQDFLIKVLPNRGRDIAPLLLGWSDELEAFDAVIHCHTKKTPHAQHGMGERWRDSLTRATFPAPEHAEVVGTLLSDQRAGLVMPWPHRFVAYNLNWGGNFSQIREIMRLLGRPVCRHTFLYFPAGSFFWANTAVLKPLWNMGLRWEDFCQEPTPGDGRLAHALERCIGLLALQLGRHSYALWAGSANHELPGPMGRSMLLQLPRHHDLADRETSLFQQGLQLAMSTAGDRNQAIALPG